MNWNRSSRSATALLVALLVLVLTVATAAAVSTSTSGVPEEALAGSETNGTYTLGKLYEDGSSEWTLTGETAMSGARWVVKKRKLGGDVQTESFTGQNFSTTVSSRNNVETVVVTVDGTVPSISNFTYEPRETFLFARLNKSVGTSVKVVTATQVHHYTTDSKRARNAILDARTAIDDAGGNPQAERTLQNAISAYNSGNFANAIDLADQARKTARQAERSSQRTQLLLFVGLGVLALAGVFGGVYYWRTKRDRYDKLR